MGRISRILLGISDPNLFFEKSDPSGVTPSEFYELLFLFKEFRGVTPFRFSLIEFYEE